MIILRGGRSDRTIYHEQSALWGPLPLSFWFSLSPSILISINESERGIWFLNGAIMSTNHHHHHLDKRRRTDSEEIAHAFVMEMEKTKEGIDSSVSLFHLLSLFFISFLFHSLNPMRIYPFFSIFPDCISFQTQEQGMKPWHTILHSWSVHFSKPIFSLRHKLG